MPSEIEQIRALLEGRSFELAQKVLGKRRLESGDYSKVFTVSFDKVLEFLVENRHISEIAETCESSRDGYYALPENGNWTVYYQEKGVRFDSRNVSSERDAFAHFAKTILRLESD